MKGWEYFASVPVGSVFSFGGPTQYKKTGNTTFKEMLSIKRNFERTMANKDLGRLVKVIR